LSVIRHTGEVYVKDNQQLLYTVLSCDIFPMVRCFLVLEDESVMPGESFGYTNNAFGEVVFSTGMDGYQESLTDPSFRGQILVMTYPIVGNYGIRNDFNQSKGVHVRALVVREYCEEPSKMYGGKTLDKFLKENKVPGISGIDTRDLVIRIRQKGTLKGAIIYSEEEIEETIKMLKKAKAPSETNLVAEVSPKKITKISNGKDITVGMIDCGAKSSILDELSKRFNVVVFPYDTASQKIVDSGVKGVLISNGPGDPSHPEIRKTVIRTVDDLSTQLPITGICFGNQMVAMGLGGSTYKMKFGHHGCNQPVKYDNRIYVTSQNHEFAVDEKSLEGTGLAANQFNVNDRTVEGTQHRDLPIFTVQYHPEAAPGPEDTVFVFDRFRKILEAIR